jgi:hypothetical protein
LDEKVSGSLTFTDEISNNYVLGYTRTALRAKTTRSILGGSPVTKFFYDEVAVLTAQISLLLEPITNWLYSVVQPASKHRHSIQDLHQSLHNIVSRAAYLSICIRLSPTIFHFVDVSPGTPYDYDDQHNLNSEIYTKSKEAVLEIHRRNLHRWTIERDDAALSVEAFPTDSDKNSREGKRAIEKHNAILDNPPTPPGRVYRAICKIGVWPIINRYKPGSDEDDKVLEQPLHEKNGQRIVQICKSAIVCYYGREDQRGGYERVRHFNRRKRKEFKVKDKSAALKVVKMVGVLGAIAGVLLMKDDPHGMLERLKEFMGDILTGQAS